MDTDDPFFPWIRIARGLDHIMASKLHLFFTGTDDANKKQRKDNDMYERVKKRLLPKTVDEVADLLIGDLMAGDAQVLSRIDDAGFNRLYQDVAAYIIDEFQIWTANPELLHSCFEQARDNVAAFDPALIILNRVRQKLTSSEGVVIIT